MKKCKISPATLARTAALALALTNQVLSATGHRVLPIESAELEQLVSTGLTIATAESCTGGMIAQRLTSVSGASEVFGYGFVTYWEQAKAKLVGVDPAVIAQYNVVSAPVAAQMALGLLEHRGLAAHAVDSPEAQHLMIEAMKHDFAERFHDPEGKNMHLEMAYTYDLDAAEAFRQEVQEAFPGLEIHMDPLSLSVSCHIGPGALAVACSKKIPELEA